jgi:ribonucleoside-triphosphate reductase
MKSEYPEVAKSYILYRDQRTKARTRQSKLIRAVMKRTEATAVENANANVDEKSFSGREKEASADVQKTIALDYTLSHDVSEAHKNMLLYQHDLEKTNIGEHNCLFVDFDKVFTNGFITRNGDVRPPSKYDTACQQYAVVFQCQSQVQFGGVGTVHADYDLAPFVAKSFRKHMENYFTDVEGLTKEDAKIVIKAKYEPCIIDNENIKNTPAYKFAMRQLEREGIQASEAMYHNLNTLESRAGSQVPFTSINFGRDTSTEGRFVSEKMLRASLSGIGKHHLTPIFPISIFQYKQGCNANPGDPNYDLKQLAIESLSKRIYPNFVNCDYSQAHEDPNNPDTFFATMGCRTMLGYDRHTNSYNRVGRGNLCPNTMILPKLGIEYGICLGKRKEPDLEGFWSAFEDLLMLCEQGLLERFDIMVNQPPEAGPFMYQNGTMKDAQKCVMSNYEALKHGTLAMGYIGIAEMCQALFGKNHAEDPDVHAFALRVVQRINEYAKEASDRHNLNFSCYATPAEGLCHTAAKALRKQYGSIPNVTDKEFLTNSHHVPVWYEISIFDKLAVEAPFCKYPTGGCITYVELDSTFVKNTKAIEQIIDYAFKTLDIPYLAFNFPIDSCLDCGYQGEFNDTCPECGSRNIQQLRRVTGYLTTDYRHFNQGKQSEVEHRIKHSKFS